jgi:hypothetical protein
VRFMYAVSDLVGWAVKESKPDSECRITSVVPRKYLSQVSNKITARHRKLDRLQ